MDSRLIFNQIEFVLGSMIKISGEDSVLLLYIFRFIIKTLFEKVFKIKRVFLKFYSFFQNCNMIYFNQ